MIIIIYRKEELRIPANHASLTQRNVFYVEEGSLMKLRGLKVPHDHPAPICLIQAGTAAIKDVDLVNLRTMPVPLIVVRADAAEIHFQ